MSSIPVKEVIYALKEYYPNADETEKIIINCAVVAAGADAVAGILPGLAVPATIISCFGAVWVMYGKLCKELGISLKENVLKLLARAVLANLAANLGGLIAAMVAGMFIPGAAILASAVVVFVGVYLAGIVFLQLILKMAEKSNDTKYFSDISIREMKETVKKTKVGKEDLEVARKVYENSMNEKKSCVSNVRLLVEDTFEITGRGTVITGVVQGGSFHIDQEVKWEAAGRENRAVIAGIEKNGELQDFAEEGDAVGMLLRGVHQEDICNGCVLQAVQQ